MAGLKIFNKQILAVRGVKYGVSSNEYLSSQNLFIPKAKGIFERSNMLRSRKIQKQVESSYRKETPSKEVEFLNGCC